jgi:LemA protein
MGLWIALGIGLTFVILMGAWVAVAYNRLVSLRQRFANAYAQIDVQLKRRYDLIPNLVETVKGYMAHERQTLEAVIAARNQALAASQQASAAPASSAAIMALAGAENMLLGALGKLFALREAYPQLKADQNTSRLMEELSSTENRIAFARQHYNDSVMAYNAFRQSFPQLLIAGPMGFGEAALFQVDDARERQVVEVQFDRPAPAQPTA